MTLKTLKELGNDTRFCSKLPMFARSELKEELQQAASELIKNPELMSLVLNIDYSNEIAAINKFIKHFFNLEGK